MRNSLGVQSHEQCPRVVKMAKDAGEILPSQQTPRRFCMFGRRTIYNIVEALLLPRIRSGMCVSASDKELPCSTYRSGLASPIICRGDPWEIRRRDRPTAPISPAISPT